MEPLTATINGFTVPATRNANPLNSPQVNTPTAAPIVPVQSTAITPESLKPAAQVTVPVAPIAPVQTTPTAQTFTNEADRILQQSQVEDTEAQQLGNKLSERIFSSLQNLTGEQQALGEAQQAAGVGKFKQQLQDINSQILKKQAELQQDDVRLIQSVQNLEQQKIPMEFITGQQQSVQRDAQIARALKASEIGILNASALATQGNIQLAMETAQQAVDLKYAPYKEEIALYKSQLEALAPILSRDEKKQAREQELKANLALKDLEARQANDKAIQDLLINAANQGAPQSLIDEAKKSGSVVDAAVKLGRYSGEYLDRQIKLAQLEKLGVETDKLRGKETGGIRGLSLEELSKFNSTPQVKAVRSASIYAQAAADYKAAINTYGTGEWFGKGSGTLNQAYSALVGATKDYYTLGTYDNGVQKLIALGIPEPSVLGLKANRIGGLDTALKSAKDQIKKDINFLINTEYNGARELQTIIDDAAALEYSTMSTDELLSQIPSSGLSVETNQAFFNPGTTSTPIR